MKKILISVVFVFCSLALLVTSCSKDSSTAKIALTNSAAKIWFDNRCASCHAAGASNASDWLYDPSDYNGSIKAHIPQIRTDVAVVKSMPNSGWNQTDSIIFITWYNAGYPAN